MGFLKVTSTLTKDISRETGIFAKRGSVALKFGFSIGFSIYTDK